MAAMATWEDGPEYAPAVRPDEFAVPDAPPLEEAPPALQPAAGAPVDRPQFGPPKAPVAPLETLVPVPADQRDPSRAFDVVSSTLTTGGPWGGVHGSQPTAPAWPAPEAEAFPGSAALASASALPAATPFPSSGFPSSGFPSSGFPTSGLPAPQLPVASGGFPAPGTPEWFGPGPYGEHRPPARSDARAVLAAATPGLLIVLAIAVLFKVLAPVLLVVAFVLCRRVKVGGAGVRRGFAVALGSVGGFAVLGLFTNPLGFGDWWSFLGVWSEIASLAMLVVTVLVVRQALRQGEQPTAPPPSSYHGPWG